MRRTVCLLVILGMCVSLLCPAEVYAGRKDPLKELFAKREAIKTFISDVTNSSEDKKVDVRTLKKSFGDALAARKSHTFEIVKRPADADITVTIDVLEYFWQETDPIDMITGYTGVAYDLIKEEHYAFMRADVKITDAKKNRSLYHDRFKATITDATMTEEASYGMMYERIAQIFLRRLFKKKQHSKWAGGR